MYAPRMQTCVKDALEQALAATKAEDVEQSLVRAEYYRLKRADHCVAMLDVLNAMYWVMNFSTYLVFIQLLARKLESASETNMNAYKRDKYC